MDGDCDDPSHAENVGVVVLSTRKTSRFFPSHRGEVILRSLGVTHRCTSLFNVQEGLLVSLEGL